MTDRPALLHVLGTLNPSGAERMLEVIGPMSAADGWRPAVLSTGEDAPGPFAPRLAAAGYAIHHLPFARDLSFVRHLLAFFRRHRFDVVHVHCERAAFWIELAARAGRVPRIVRTVHGVFAFTGALRARRWAQRTIARRLLGVASAGHSPSVMDNERQRFANPVRYIPAWVDPAFRPPTADERAQARDRLGLADGTLAVVAVGNCLAVKNHTALLRAVARLAADGRNIHLLHAGHGPLESEERALAAAEGIAGRVRFLGAVDDVRSLLHAGDAYAMPSLWEGLGVAALEAFACGLPAVLADSSGLRDLRHFGPAIRWCGTDPDSIAAALADLDALTPAERRERAAEASAIARRDHGAAAGWAASRDLYAGPSRPGTDR
ncbi:MAG TPA: glycosyltransferase [Azospirillum sp.]